MRYVVINVCWGQEYIRLLTDYSMPATLAPGNLPYMAAHGEVLYRLYIAPDDFPALQASPAFQLLQKIVQVQVNVKFLLHIQDVYETSFQAIREAIAEFADGENRLIFISPNLLFSDGSFKRAVQAAENGFRALGMAGPMTYRLNEFLQAQGKVPVSWPLSACTINAWALKFNDDYTSDNLWRNDGVADFPAIPFWRVGNEGFIYHLLLPHCFMAWPRKDTPPMTGAIDWYLQTVCKDASECDMELDSDNLNWLTSRRARVSPFHANTNPITYTRGFIKRFAPVLRELFKRSIRAHAGEMREDLWAPVEREANAVIEEVCR